MRIFSYILTALVTIFVINIALSFSLPTYRNVLVNIRSNFYSPSTIRSQVDKVDVGDRENTRLVESLDRIDKHIESLAELKKVDEKTMMVNGAINNLSGTIFLEEDMRPKELDIPLSGIFLAKIMPEVTLKKVENDGFFGIKVMGNVQYNTYWDERKKIKIYAFRETYNDFLLNMKLTSSVYSLNETDQFFGYTFFLNLLKKDSKDTMIRFVISLEGRAIGIEVPANYYLTFKKILLKNK